MGSHRFVAAGLIVLCAALWSVALAAQPGTAVRRAPVAPASKPVPIVMLTKGDGTLLRGQVTGADPAGVTFVAAPKAGAAAGDASPVVIPWREIKSVSNGITEAKVVADWKAAHAEELCADCHGDQTKPCETCKGTGHDPAALKDCAKCHGEMMLDCKTPKCDHGKVPCPATCLKRYEGKWVPHDGKTVRFFTVRGGGQAWFSEGHAGDLIVMNKEGVPEDKGRCTTCGGTTYVPDGVCHGTGKVPCPTCVAKKDAPGCPGNCDHGRVACATCGGTGIKKG